MGEELKTGAQNIDDSRVPVEMWDSTVWEYEGERESGALKVIWDSILKWRRQKFTI